jgi:hypothetical protein
LAFRRHWHPLRAGPGFNIGKFLSFFLLITFAYFFVKFYDSSIPGIGYSLQSFVRGRTNNIVDLIGSDTTSQMLNQIEAQLQKSGPGIATYTAPYMLLAFIATELVLAILSALVAVIIGYGAVAVSIVGLLGPVFIPFMV